MAKYTTGKLLMKVPEPFKDYLVEINKNEGIKQQSVLSAILLAHLENPDKLDWRSQIKNTHNLFPKTN